MGINHLEGHLAAAYLGDVPVGEPHLAMVVSGGYTQFYAVTGFGQYELIGGTRDDAAGECFDKVAKVMGLPYPGGFISTVVRLKAMETRTVFQGL